MTIRILMIEDEAADAELVTRELRRAGLDFTCLLTQDKPAFLEALTKVRPDLILADYSLPGFDGLSALALARERFGQVPVIIVSGAIGEETAIESLKAGATDYVLKQHLTRLGPVVRRALEEVRQLAERQHAEEALRESEERYRNLFNTMDEGFCIVEMIFDAEGKAADYRFLKVNAAFERQTGLHDAEGKLIRELAPAHEQHWFDVFGTVALTGESARLVSEARALNRWYDVYAYRIGRPEDRQVAILFSDITERKLGERALQEMNETLERRVAARTAEVQRLADQLRALASDLSQTEQRERKRLATILHDHIQQLLVAARMQLEWVRTDNRPERFQTTVQGVVGILREATDAVRSLTVELSPPVLQDAGLIGGLTWLASRMREKNQFTVNLRSDSKAEPASEEMRLLLFEAVRELLFNAVKHSGVAEADVALVRTKDDMVRVIVRDNGKGFDPELLGRRRPEDDTFGLFSIQQRLAHVGGQMEIAATPGAGTKVTLTVPAGKRQGGAVGRADSEETQVEMGAQQKPAACRVLIVDDHKIMREGLVGLLRLESDIEVVGEAADGPQAIELAGRLKPDAVIMDVTLGAMSGVEATRRILAANPKIKVIGLSMHTDKEIASAMRDAGAVAYLTKGGPPEDLIAAVRACRAL